MKYIIKNIKSKIFKKLIINKIFISKKKFQKILSFLKIFIKTIILKMAIFNNKLFIDFFGYM
jgi:hypothetical protein